MQSFHKEVNKVFIQLRKIQFLTMFLSILKILLRFLLIIQIQKTIDSLSLNNLDITQDYLKSCIILLTMFFIINCVFQYCFRNLQYTSHYTLMKTLFGMSLNKSYAFHSKYTPSAILSMIKDDSKFIADWNSIGVILIIGHVLTLTFAFLLMLRYNLIITLIIFSVIVLCFSVTHFISKKIGNKTYDLQVSNTEFNQKIIDYLNGVKDIKQYKKEKFFQNRLSDFIDKNTYKHSKSISQYYSIFTSTYAMLTVALPILTILVGAILVLNNQYTIGELIATYALVGNLQEPVQVIPDYLNQRRQALKMQNKIMPILEKNSDSYSCKELDPMDHFAFYSNAYSFEDGKTILRNINFVINKGEAVIIKGESGKGKSSLLNLISRFYSTEGQSVIMKYNGIPVETISPKVYYQHILQGQQIPYIFRDTVYENITLGEEYTIEELQEVIDTVCLVEFVDAKGLDYILEQNGDNISGGQKQRIGIARVLLRKPNILMLDEPTSALDQELISIITEKIVTYCEKYEIALVLVSHNDSFERYYQMFYSDQIKLIQV